MKLMAYYFGGTILTILLMAFFELPDRVFGYTFIIAVVGILCFIIIHLNKIVRFKRNTK